MDAAGDTLRHSGACLPVRQRADFLNFNFLSPFRLSQKSVRWTFSSCAVARALGGVGPGARWGPVTVQRPRGTWTLLVVKEIQGDGCGTQTGENVSSLRDHFLDLRPAKVLEGFKNMCGCIFQPGYSPATPLMATPDTRGNARHMGNLQGHI